MKKKIFISLLLVAFFNYINGCIVTKTERVPPSKMVLSEEVIREAVLPDLEVIKFDEQGGRYIGKPASISGTLENGKQVEVPVNDIKIYRISNVEPAAFSDIAGQKIREVLLKNGVLIIFDSNGGVYDEKAAVIIGVLEDQQEQKKIKIDNVSEIYLESPESIINPDTSKIKDMTFAQVITSHTSLLYKFDKNGGKFVSGQNRIVGVSKDYRQISLDPDSILYVNVERTDPVGSIFATLGIVVALAGVVVLIIIATKESCPFIYSFDGDRYVFDAEPLGGATTKGLERTEYSKMDYLKSVDGNFRMLVRNEVEETQHIDELALMAVTHDPDKEVIPDLEGNFYQIKDPAVPVYASDENGLDLRKAVSADDNLYWQSKLPADSTLISERYRHELTFIFTGAKDKTNAKLVVNMGTSLWGSRMIKEMLQLYGSYVDEYYDKIDQRGSDYEQMMNFIENEELYKLKYYTKAGDGWKFQGFINGGGPLVAETRVYGLDLSGNESDSIILKVNPPIGFWTVDYLAVQYDSYPSPEITYMVQSGPSLNQDGIDVSSLIKSKDNSYCIMPEVGDYFETSFADNNTDNKNVTYYLKSTGYYEIHIDKTLPFRFTTLSSFIYNPGYIVKYANERYREWKRLNN